jgi:predicted nuclease with TOPRIM domain
MSAEDALNALRSRVMSEQSLGQVDAVDLLNLTTILYHRLERASAEVSELRRQVETLMRERSQTEQVVLEAQSIVANSGHSLAGLLSRLEAAEQDVFISTLVRQGAEITYQPCEAEHRTDEQTFVGRNIAEAVALAHQHLQETT